MEALYTYSYMLVTSSVALLLVAAGIAKSQLVWKQRRSRARRRRYP